MASQIREDVVEDVVADVRDRARVYGFSYSGRHAAMRLVQESAEVLDLDITPQELEQAIERLH